MNKTLKLKKIIPLIPFIVLFVTLFIIHFRLGYVNDDLYFRALITENGLNQILNLVHHRYYSWSSRFLIEFVLLFLSYLPIIMGIFKQFSSCYDGLDYSKIFHKRFKSKK